MEEVTGTTNLMRLVDRMRSEMTEAYYDETSDRMKMTKPEIKVSLKDTYGSWFGADIKLSITLKQLKDIMTQHERHIEDARVWMGQPRYEYTVYGGSWSNSIDICMKFDFDDLRVKGDDGFIGYTDADGRTVLWNHSEEE